MCRKGPGLSGASVARHTRDGSAGLEVDYGEWRPREIWMAGPHPISPTLEIAATAMHGTNDTTAAAACEVGRAKVNRERSRSSTPSCRIDKASLSVKSARRTRAPGLLDRGVRQAQGPRSPIYKSNHGRRFSIRQASVTEAPQLSSTTCGAGIERSPPKADDKLVLIASAQIGLRGH